MDADRETVRRYYDENAQREWERLERHPLELLFTTHMMERHIRPGDRILDIGGGPGRYALHYAGLGCDVTLVDLSPGNIALAAEKAAERNVRLSLHACDCLALDSLDLGTFDHVFLMGPLYHLPRETDRREAVRQALLCLRPGGLLYCSFILPFAGLIYDLKNGPGFLPQDLADPQACTLVDAIASGESYTGPGFTSVCFCHQREIGPFLAPFGLERVHLFGQEGILALSEKQVLAFPKEEFDLWVETAKRLLECPELLALSEHAMYIGRKRGDGHGADGAACGVPAV